MVTLDDIEQARTRVRGVAVHTPLVLSHKTDGDTAAYFKPEGFQPIGSFKIRGAYNRLAALTPQERELGVIAYSSGNHAQGVAYAALKLGLKATIVMPRNAPAVKIAATRSFGANVVLYDPATEKREEVAARLMAEKPAVLVPPFDDPYVIAGQGTIGLEIVEDLPDIDLVLVPVGGGGLLSGVATAIKSVKPHVKVIGIEPELAADAQESFRSGRVVEITAAHAGRTIADGVRTQHVSELTLAHIQRYVDDIITVSEAEIRDATRHIVLNAKLVTEPSGALSFAAFNFHRSELPPARNVVMIVSGGNIEPRLWPNCCKNRRWR